MKKYIIALMLTMGITALAIAQNGPSITFEASEHNLGQVMYGKAPTCNFVFKNTGDQPLILSNARGSCPCIKVEWPKEPIQPGASGCIKVQILEDVGSYSKTIIVTSNATNDPRLILRVKGNILPVFTKRYNNGKMGMEDNYGNVLVPAKYDTIARKDPYGYATAQLNGKLGVINYTTNKVVIPFEYTSLCFSPARVFDEEGLMPAKKNGKWGIVDKNNKVLIPFIYDESFSGLGTICVFSKDGKTKTKKGGKNVIIDKNNHIIGTY